MTTRSQADGQIIKKVLLETIEEYSYSHRGSLQTTSILEHTFRKLQADQYEFSGEVLLTVYYDLFRLGLLSWGLNLSNPGPPFFHVTEQGRATLRYLSRDPYNPDGYLNHLNNQVKINPIAKSYIEEALNTFNANCFKATAVMVGGAAESIILELRDTTVGQIKASGLTPSKDLQDWRVSKVLDALEKDLDQQKKKMPRQLAEGFRAYWPALTQQIRVARNAAGHPESIDPVTPETVHASLLIFPELAKLGYDLIDWVSHHYV